MQIATLEGIFDELQKIGASSRMAGYMQARRGTRPIRAHNLASKGFVQQDEVPQPPDMDQPPEPEPVREEDEGSAIGKIAQLLTEKRKEKALEGFARARPYVVSGVKGAVPAALVGKMLVGEGPRGSKAARVMGIVGGSLGVANEALKSWAEKHKRKSVAKQILKDHK